MANNRYQKNSFTIFAITATAKDGGDPLVFVEKTQQKDLKAVLRYYRNHNGIASPIFEEGCNIRIHHLQFLNGSVTEAYPYTLAYMRFFFEKGYDVIAPLKAYEAALDLGTKAQTIYNLISGKTVDSILSAPPLLESVCHNKKPLSKKTPLTSRLSIRLSENEHLQYHTYCKEQHVTQRDALLMLLSQSKSSETSSAKRIQEQANIIEQQRQHIHHLDSLIKRGPQGAKADKRILDSLHLCKSGLHIYFQHLFSNHVLPPALPCTTWECFKRECSDWREYQYPTDSTPFFFQLEHMCYGKGPNACIFLFGKNPNTDQKVRLRFYDKREYIGPHPTRSPYFYQNAYLLMLCRQDDSGAADMLLGLPIPNNSSQATEPDNCKAPTSLNDLLLDATNRSQQSDCVW